MKQYQCSDTKKCKDGSSCKRGVIFSPPLTADNVQMNLGGNGGEGYSGTCVWPKDPKQKVTVQVSCYCPTPPGGPSIGPARSCLPSENPWAVASASTTTSTTASTTASIDGAYVRDPMLGLCNPDSCMMLDTDGDGTYESQSIQCVGNDACWDAVENAPYETGCETDSTGTTTCNTPMPTTTTTTVAD